MFNTHDMVKEICDHIRNEPSRYSGIRFYPSMPYAHKYANAVAEKGIFGAVKDAIVSDSNISDAIGILTRGGASFFEKDMIKVMKILVDIEMKIFQGLDVKVMFLQNIVTDLMLGIGIKEVFTAFANHIRENHGAEPGFVTLNMPRLVDFLYRLWHRKSDRVFGH